MPTDVDVRVTTFAVSPAIDVIKVTFTHLQNKMLLLIAQQEKHIKALIGSLTRVFAIDIVDSCFSQG